MKIHLSESVYNKLILEEINLSSFKMQETLNPDIFDENEKMHKDVRKLLLKIGKDFYDYLGVSWVDLDDIILTGSLANYNWSKFSDVDLHVVIPYSQISKNDTLVDEFAWTKKELWNNEHDLNIKDYEIELYAQNTKEDLVAGGVYSVLYDKWLKKPEKFEVTLDQNEINRIVSNFEDKIGDLIRRYLAGDCYGLSGDIDDLKGEIRDLRKSGLSSEGEFSPKNIAFKSLRRMGLLDKLSDMKDELYDDSLSIEKTRKEKADDGDLIKRPRKKKKTPEKDKEEKTGVPQWEINGQKYISVRDAAKATGVPKSTVAYRADSDNFPSWKNLTKK